MCTLFWLYEGFKILFRFEVINLENRIKNKKSSPFSLRIYVKLVGHNIVKKITKVSQKYVLYFDCTNDSKSYFVLK